MKKDCIKLKACIDASNGSELPCETCNHYIPRPGTINDKKIRMDRKMNNKLADLNDKLFQQLDRLNDESISRDDLSTEISRSQAICGVSNQIISNAALALKAHTTLNTGMTKKAPKMLED
jgi:hypothetical protein